MEVMCEVTLDNPPSSECIGVAAIVFSLLVTPSIAVETGPKPLLEISTNPSAMANDMVTSPLAAGNPQPPEFQSGGK
jgi:hypothetical protein